MAWLPSQPNFEDFISELNLGDFRAMQALEAEVGGSDDTFMGFAV
jgi:hypothetical protein